MESWYEDMIDRIRFIVERDRGLEILTMTREEIIELLKDNEENTLIMRQKKREDARESRCVEMCNALKTMIDGFCATEQPTRAEEFVWDLCDMCLLTCAVEWDLPLYFYLELMEFDGIKIAIDSLVNSIVGEIADETIIEIPLEDTFLNRLTALIVYRAKEQRRKGQAEIVRGNNSAEYIMDLKI